MAAEDGSGPRVSPSSSTMRRNCLAFRDPSGRVPRLDRTAQALLRARCNIGTGLFRTRGSAPGRASRRIYDGGADPDRARSARHRPQYATDVQSAMREEFIGCVESVTGRKVESYESTTFTARTAARDLLSGAASDRDPASRASARKTLTASAPQGGSIKEPSPNASCALDEKR